MNIRISWRGLNKFCWVSKPDIQYTWGCTGFDAVIGKSGLRVRAMFSVINDQIKTNAESNVVYANFGQQRLAA